jgi:hypothetical protein
MAESDVQACQKGRKGAMVSTARKRVAKRFTAVERERRYTCQQVAAILGVSYEKVLSLCDTNLLGHHDIQPRNESYSLRMITHSQLEEFIERTLVMLV